MKQRLFFLMIFLFIAFTDLFSQTELSVIKDVHYCDDTLTKHLLDIYLPVQQNKPAPCIIWIHGGGWGKGHKAEDGGVIDHLKRLLENGYALVSINYRLSSDSIFPACVYDCKTAIRFIKANSTRFNIDSSRIAVAGPSAGGHLAALVGTSAGIKDLEKLSMGNSTSSSRVYAVLDLFGPTDFSQMDIGVPLVPPDSCTHPLAHNHINSPETKLLGCLITDCPGLVKKANPITYITSDDPPFLIVHGSFDCLVSPRNSIILNQALKNNNVPSEFILLNHARHGGREFKTIEMQNIYLDFFNKALYGER